MTLFALIAALLLPQEKNEALDVWKKMEEKVTKAKTLTVNVTAKGVETNNGKDHEEGGDMKILLGTDGRVGVWSTDSKRKSDQVVLLSDGTQLHGRKQKIHDKIRPNMALRFARAGGIGFIGDFDPDRKLAPDADYNATYAMSDLKIAKTEKVGDEEARVLEYTLKMKDLPFVYKVTVWISTKTDLPLKRTTFVSKPDDPDEADHTLTMNETYTITVDADIPAESFKPK